jgi:tetratricopeptide (TPR) repeat protein
MNISGSGSNAQWAAEKALSLNPDLAVAHVILAGAKLYELDWAAAQKERQLAVKLNPHSEEVLLAAAMESATMGQTNEAMNTLERALRANPDDASKMRAAYAGFVYAWSRQYGRAVETYKQNPNVSFWAAEQYAQVFVATGDYVTAMRLEKQAALDRGGNPKNVNAEFDALEKAYREQGIEQYWKQSLLFEAPRNGERHPMRMAAIHARLKQPDEAFKWLDRASNDSPVRFAFEIQTNPSFDSLRTDPRFKVLLNELWRKK